MADRIRLFAVELRTVAIVQANSGAEAIAIAEDEQREIISDALDLDVDVLQEVSTPKDIATYGYDEKCLPYGGDGNTRLGDLLRAMAEQPAPAERCTRTLELPLEGAA